jgi:hypothetical protein
MQAVYGRSVGPETKPSDSGSTGDGESAICQLPSAVLLHGVIPEDDRTDRVSRTASSENVLGIRIETFTIDLPGKQLLVSID